MANPTDADRLAFASELLIGSVENGPWVLIGDPDLRRVVGEYVADTCYSVAAAAGLDEAMERAHDAMPQRLARSLPGPTLAPDSRERLARHQFLRSVGGAESSWGPTMALAWDRGDPKLDKARWYSEADTILAVITGKEG